MALRSTVIILTSLCNTPPLVNGSPLLDLGRFEKSNGPSQEGLLDLGLFEISNGPSQQGLLDIGLFEMSNGPSQVVAKTL